MCQKQIEVYFQVRHFVGWFPIKLYRHSSGMVMMVI